MPCPTRFHFFHVNLNRSAAFPSIRVTLLDTRVLKGTGNTSFVGDAYAFTQDELSTSRFDPESARVNRAGNF